MPHPPLLVPDPPGRTQAGAGTGAGTGAAVGAGAGIGVGRRLAARTAAAYRTAAADAARRRFVPTPPPSASRAARDAAARLVASDLALFVRVGEVRSPVLDAVLPRLSRAADHSMLWTAAAAALSLTDDRHRRAAVRGLVSIGVASGIANGPLKWATRRSRPALDAVPHIRRVRRQPRTTSFPSGHAATSVAFATGVAIDSPAAAAPIALLAGAVAASRVYVGVHYPGDVLAGAALGAGAALLTTRVMPRRPSSPARATPASARAPALADGAGLVMVVNDHAGKAGRHSPAELLRDELPAAEIIEVGADESLGDAIADAARRATVLGIAGGDGSTNSAASVASRSGLPLAVVPAGTFDHFAADLGVDNAEDTVAALRAGTAVAVDLGVIEVSGDEDTDGTGVAGVFLNTASIGGYPEMVELRERLERRIGKWPAVLIALVRVLRANEPVDIELDGERRRLWLLFVGNGVYHPPGFAPTYRIRLDDGLLDLRLVDAVTPLARTRLVLAVLTATLARSRVYETRAAARVHVRLLGDQPMRLARDGEVRDAPREFTLALRPRRMVVYRPGG